MHCAINGNLVEFSEDTTLDMLLFQQKFADQGIAVAVNDEVISKDNWSKTIIKANDNILIITATQGG